MPVGHLEKAVSSRELTAFCYGATLLEHGVED